MMNFGNKGIATRILYDFIACFLIIISHFTNYLLYAGYTKIFPDIAAVVGLLCAVALVLTAILQVPSFIIRVLIYAVLITVILGDAIFEYGTASFSGRLITLAVTLLAAVAFVFFLREHTNKVLIGAFLAILVSTIAMQQFAVANGTDNRMDRPNGVNNGKPLVVHLVLDEHIGLAGMSSRVPGGEKIRREVRDFLTRSGFRIFENAYSQFFETSNSLATALNFDASGQPQHYLTKRRYGFSLDRNAYLERAAALNYDIRVYQSNYFDFCSARSASAEKCVSYKPDMLSQDAIGGLSFQERVRLLTSMYYSSFAVIKLLKLYGAHADESLAPVNVSAFAAKLWHGRIGPLAVMPTLDRVTEDIVRAGPGTLFFVHLLMPHYPYVYTADCSVRSPISSWRLRTGSALSSNSRDLRYKDYFEQVRCTMRKLTALFDIMKRKGVYDDATIVIHGDHGSRINMDEPMAAAAPRMSVDDFMDGYSTLFALKADGIEPGTDRRMLSLPRLLEYAATGDRNMLSSQGRHLVYVPGKAAEFIGVPMPFFPGVAK